METAVFMIRGAKPPGEPMITRSSRRALSRAVRPVLVGIALVGVVAACSSSPAGKAKAAGAPTPAGQTQSKHAASGSVGDGLGHPVNVCALLPVATVASVTGENLSVAKETDTLSYKIYSCDYTSADGTSGLTVDVLADEAAVGYDANVQAAQTAGGTVKQISGLGDKADSTTLGVEALFGNVSVTVTDLQSDQAAVTLIRTLQPKL
jgi:hypothetical protein